MGITKDTALIDNDFLEHIVEINRGPEEKVEMMKKAFRSLSISAAMHPLVFEKELVKAQTRLCFFDTGVVDRLLFSDCFAEDSDEESYYCWLVPELYKKFMGKELGAEHKDVLTYWISHESFGEVHSMAMCLVCGCAMFLSDDRGSKMLRGIIEREYSETIRVYNRKDFVAQMPDGVFSRSERKSFSHPVKNSPFEG